MAGNRVPRPALDLAQHGLELFVGEGLDLAAAVADEVMVVLAGAERRLVPCDAGAEVDPLHEPVLGELVEHPVHGGDADPAALAPEPVEDLLRRQAAVFAAEQVDDRAARAAAAALRFECGERLGAPRAEGSPCHPLDHSGNQYR